MLSTITLLSAPHPDYPFSVPAIRSLTTLRLSPSRITFFTGENGLESVSISTFYACK